MNGHIDSYYTRTQTDAAVRPVLTGTIEADTCVVGGGLAGVAVALGLAERGKSVVLLESNRLGWAASGRNGGFVLSGFAAGEKEIIARTGIDNARTLFRCTQDALKLIKKRIATYKIPCDPVDGHLKCSWFDDPDSIRAKVDFLREHFDEPVEYWPREQVRDTCRTKRYYDGYFNPSNFHMHALNYVTGIARAIESNGGRIFENSAALAVEEGPAGHTVRAAQGAVKCHDIVFCGSAYFNGIEKKLSRACLPVSTYVMVSEPVPTDILIQTITKPYAIRDTRWTDDYYRLLPDNRILWGGRCGLGRTVPADLPRLMTVDLLKIYPQLEGHIKPAVAWAGVMGYTVHKMPHIGRLRPGIWACTNFGGSGLGPTTAGGEIIAAAIAEGDDAWKLFAPFGYNYTGGILGPFVAQAVYHSWGIGDAIREFWP